MKRVLLTAALAAAVLVPTASASRPHSLNLALVPLPKSALGPAASSFPLSHDSGPVSNANAASHTADATPRTFKKLGRVNGYGLEYGNAFTGAAGITDVRTSIEQYKTFADARRALAFWRKEDARLVKLNNPGLSVTSAAVQLPAPAARTSHFAYLTAYSAANIAPVAGIDDRSPTAATSWTSSSRPVTPPTRKRSRRPSPRSSTPASGSRARGACTPGW